MPIPEKFTLGATRTPDTLLRTEVFYPLNYEGLTCSHSTVYHLAYSTTGSWLPTRKIAPDDEVEGGNDDP